MKDVLISIHPRYVDAIQNGDKTVELRTRTPQIDPGTRLWIYTTMPVAKIQLVAKVAEVNTDSPTSIWRRFSNDMAISRSVFREYCRGHRSVCAIALRDVSALDRELSLDNMRQSAPNFHPPQFFTSLT